jgi:hypothetical protein
MAKHLVKTFKVPEIYDAKVLETMFTDLFELCQEKYIIKTYGKPTDSVGKNRETRVDESTKKVYVKMNGTWTESQYTYSKSNLLTE